MHPARSSSSPPPPSLPPCIVSSFPPFFSLLYLPHPSRARVLSPRLLFPHPRLLRSSRVVSVRPRWRCLGGFIGRSRRKRTKSPFLDNALSRHRRRCLIAREDARGESYRRGKGSLKTTVAWLAGWLTGVAGRSLLLYVPATDDYKKFISLRVPRLGRLPLQCARPLTFLYLLYVARLCGKR